MLRFITRKLLERDALAASPPVARFRRVCQLVIGIGCTGVLGLTTAIARADDHDAATVLASIQLADDDLEISLVAAEPTIVDPVAARFDERGRLWVVEMRDYPTGPAEGDEPSGRIVILTDTDQDGFFESSTTFADKLMFPTGLQPWKGGAIVTLAGEIAYFHDVDNDGVSDSRETWFTGFAEDNEQLRANHPTLGPDGMIYVPCGLRGGMVADARPGHVAALPVSVNGRDFRFDPNGDKFDAIAGRGQFGLTFDSYGRRFVCMNAAPLDHIVIEEATLGRNPHLADSTTIEHVIPGGQTEPVYPLVEQWTTSTFHKGSWTAACGVHIHCGDSLGNRFNGNAFICEPTGALVHREILSDAGPTFAGQAAYEKNEFLASTDIWFRPVNLLDGPDGALYIVDMARKEIEHPQWLPPEARERYDFVSGDTLGRIYRVGKKGTKPGVFHERSPAEAGVGSRGRSPIEIETGFRNGRLIDLTTLTNDDLRHVLLSTRSSWLRKTAFRLLLERSATFPRDELRASARLEGRIAMLNAKAIGNMLKMTDVQRALQTDEPRLHEAAIRLAASTFRGSELLRSDLIAATYSADAKVRFQAAIALGPYSGADVLDALVALAVKDSNDAWMRRANLSSISGSESEFASKLLTISENADLVQAAFELATRAAVAQQKAGDSADGAAPLAVAVVDAEVPDSIKRAAFLGIANSQQFRTPRDAFKLAAETLDRLTEVALADFRNGDVEAAEFVGWYSPPSDSWGQMLREPIDVAARTTLIARLARRSDFPIDHEFLSSLGELAPSVRASVLNAMWGPSNRATALLEAVRDGRLNAPLIDNTVASRLRKHRDKAVAKLAAEVLPAQNANRVAVIHDYKPCLELDCAVGNGIAVFKKHCATCHRIGDTGGNVGPDLSDLRSKTPEQLLQAILDPNAAIDANYVNHTAVTTDGRVVSGLLVSQSESAVTLRGTDAKDVTIFRNDLESFTATGQSIMPEGLERQLNSQAMADVIYYLKNWRFENE